MAKDLVVAIQDMGAAGLTSSSFEMASKGGVGLKLHLDKVPLRDATATPEEILLSESQERMLLICRPEKLDELQAVFKKWDLDAAVIGEVQKEQLMELYWHGEKICSVNPDLLVESAPVYERPYKKWKPQVRATQRTQLVPSVENLKTTLLELLSDISGTSRKWIYKQYDQRVGASTARGCEENFAVLRLPDSGRALGVALGCRPYVMRMDAALGGKDALFYPALEMAAKGFSTLAVTDCLNFGNPEKSEVMSEFVAAVEGLSHACHSLDAPVISGNVSFYNETHEKNVTSTPATGVVGLRDSLENIPYSQFKTSGQQIYLLRLNQFQHMGQVGEFLQQQTVSTGDLNETEMAEFTRFVCKLVNTQPVRASRVVGKFGLAYNLARMCTSQLGCVIHKGDFLIDESQQGSWLSETGYEVLLVVDKIDSDKFAKAWSQLRSPHSKDQLWRIGEVVRERFVIEGACDMSTDEVVRAYEAGWNQHFKSLA